MNESSSALVNAQGFVVSKVAQVSAGKGKTASVVPLLVMNTGTELTFQDHKRIRQQCPRPQD